MLVTGMAVGLCGCSAATSRQSEKSLYEHGMEMVDLIRQMADSEEVLAVKFGLDRDKLDELNSAPEGEPIAALAHMRKSSLDCAYQIKIPLEAYWELVESYLEEQGLDVDDIPQEVRERLLCGVYNSMLSTINSSLNMETLMSDRGYSTTYTMTLINNFSISDAFVSNEVEEDVAYLYMFEDAAVLVMFTKSAGGAVTAYAVPVFTDKIVGASRSEIRELLEKQMARLGFEVEVKVADITP